MASKLKNLLSGHEWSFDESGVPRIDLATGEYLMLGSKRLYYFTTDITANTTETTAPAGSLAITTSDTGKYSVFVSDAAKWQFFTNA